MITRYRRSAPLVSVTAMLLGMGVLLASVPEPSASPGAGWCCNPTPRSVMR